MRLWVLFGQWMNTTGIFQFIQTSPPGRDELDYYRLHHQETIAMESFFLQQLAYILRNQVTDQSSEEDRFTRRSLDQKSTETSKTEMTTSSLSVVAGAPEALTTG
jgi:hypothetical protein